jgi:hypothetical protein
MVRIKRRLISVAGNAEGIALIEFAIVLPVLMILFLGTIETARYFLFREKLETAATQMLDITTQNTNVNALSLDHLYSALPDMMTPYNMEQTRVIVTQIVRPVDPSPGQRCSTVALWQYLPGGSKIAPVVGGIADTGSIELSSGDNMMAIEVFTNYKPLLDSDFTRKVIGNPEIYILSYGHTRYGSFNIDPSTGKTVKAVCS